MNNSCFLRLANEMKIRGLLNDSRMVSVEEQLAIFIFTLAHNERNRVVQNRFQHPGETISRHFNKYLQACVRLEKLYLTLAGRGVRQEISSNQLFYPWFKDCVGAIDGTHIPAWVPVGDQQGYRNRKGFLSQNVLAVVVFDMNFQYVLAGWEGSASDSRVLRNAIWERQQNKLKVPNGKYYVVDAGYANTKGFLAPYHGTRYHLREWSQTQAPQTARELFNLRHLKLRNVVERTFAWNWDDEFFEEDMENEIENCESLNNIDFDSDSDEELGDGPTDDDKQYMFNFRDRIAQNIWNPRAIR
ncbi:uncharacterized protein LOC115696587 [Cannabis sativa]|uniref:uncharacterized protein LOC115696587 n=1 Tax=Cannabis sativa TaxID=3483 RepID=UPI0011E04791|nr:uncharacterized protein LOC115696587 [Cannabis sativa]